jgi:hypothetical protein
LTDLSGIGHDFRQRIYLNISAGSCHCETKRLCRISRDDC